MAPRKGRMGRPSNEPKWLEDAIRDDRGNIIGNVANALLALRENPALSDCFAYDEMRRTIMLTKRVPSKPARSGDNQSPQARPVRDTDATSLQEYLQHFGIPRIGKDTIFQAIEKHAQERGFHPVRDYLDGLVWDGQNRIDGWLVKYLGAEPSHVTDAIGEMFLAAMVARVFQPGCKADYMLVLEGKQGTGKSTACGIIGGDYFSDALPDVRLEKESANHLRGKWVLEIPELSSIKGAEDRALKAFLSRTTERYRPAYGRLEVEEPRQCVFVGTTNESVYLHDETGARRYWPVKTGKVDLDGLAHARDQLFAEAVHAYRGGLEWWPDKEFERVHLKPIQDARFEADPWEETIAAFVADKSTVMVKEIARGALEITADQLGTKENRRVTAVLERLGWKRSDKKRDGYNPWIRPESRLNLRLVA